MSSIKFDVYGRHLLILRASDGWNIDYLSGQWKKRPATEIFIPSQATLQRRFKNDRHSQMV
jgi:hypothetical protein